SWGEVSGTAGLASGGLGLGAVQDAIVWPDRSRARLATARGNVDGRGAPRANRPETSHRAATVLQRDVQLALAAGAIEGHDRLRRRHRAPQHEVMGDAQGLLARRAGGVGPS